MNMIFKRRYLKTFPQIEIAEHMGLVVPPNQLFNFPFARESDNAWEWGVQSITPYSIGMLFSHLKVDLAFKFIPIHNISGSSVFDFLEDNLLLDNDIMIGYDYKEAFGRGMNVGHVSLIYSLNTISLDIILVDPEENNEVVVQYPKLARAIHNKLGGFWVFSTSLNNILSDYI
jgi:hypothetical protein